jgi:antitoxin CptB
MPQIRWQCRRGMRELDELLLQYLENGHEQADAAEKSAFQTLLALSDPELISYLLQQQEPPLELHLVIGKIRRGTAT